MIVPPAGAYNRVELERLNEYVNLAFSTHPFLSQIVSRSVGTVFRAVIGTFRYSTAQSLTKTFGHFSSSFSAITKILLNDVKLESQNKLLYDIVVIAGMDLKARFAENQSGVPPPHLGLPSQEKLVRVTNSTMYGVKLGSLTAAKLHIYVQCITLLAWHDLLTGLVR